MKRPVGHRKRRHPLQSGTVSRNASHDPGGPAPGRLGSWLGYGTSTMSAGQDVSRWPRWLSTSAQAAFYRQIEPADQRFERARGDEAAESVNHVLPHVLPVGSSDTQTTPGH
jgi:hypothetical protein